MKNKGKRSERDNGVIYILWVGRSQVERERVEREEAVN